MVNVRKAKEKDIDRILELLKQVNLVHALKRSDLFKIATKYTKEELVEIINNEKTPVFVGVDENDVTLGYAFCVYKQFLNDNIMTDVKTLYIDDICVDEVVRGKHVGTAIFNYVKQFAKENDFYNITLNVWELNPIARKFYEKMGLVPQKTVMETIVK